MTFNIYSTDATEGASTNSIYIPLDTSYKLSQIQSILLHDRNLVTDRTKFQIRLYNRNVSLDNPIFATKYITDVDVARVHRYDFQEIPDTTENSNGDLLLNDGFENNTIYNGTSDIIKYNYITCR